MKKKTSINIKKSHKGLLHKDLGIPEGEKIPASKLKIKESDSPAIKKRKQFAINAKKFKHENGGLLYAEEGIQMPDLFQGVNYQQPNGALNFKQGLSTPQLDNPFQQYQINKPLQKQPISIPSITGATNFGQQIETPEINPWDFYNPQTGELNDPQQTTNTNKPQNKIPNFNIFGGNKYFQRANMFRNKAIESFSNINSSLPPQNQGLTGSRYGGKIPKAEGGMSIASGIGNDLLANVNTGKGFLDVIGDLQNNIFTKQYEAQQLRQSLFSDRENLPPNFQQFGSDFSGNNPAYFKYSGTVNNFKDEINPNVLVEGGGGSKEGEFVQTPQGESGMITGDTHDAPSEGVALNLPEGSMVSSMRDKLKVKEKATFKDGQIVFEPLKKATPLSKVQKPLSTDKLEEKNPQTDSVAMLTKQLMKQGMNTLSTANFQKVEEAKVNGDFGKKLQKEALQNYHQMPNGELMENSEMMKFGGLTKAPWGVTVDGKRKYIADNKKPLAGTKGIGESNFNGDLDQLYSYLIKHGYKGTEDIGHMQSFIAAKDPSLVANYMSMVKPNNKAIDLFNQQLKKDGKKAVSYEEVRKNPSNYPIWTTLSPQERVQAFKDYKWDYRAPKFQEPAKTLNPAIKQPLVGDTASPSATFNPTNTGNTNSLRGLNFNFAIPSTYSRLPLSTTQLDPQYIKPNLRNIQPELNQVTRGYNAFASNLGSRGTNDISNLLQGQINQYNQNEQIFGSKYNADNQSISQANQFNAQSKMNIDQLNLGERNRFLDQIQRREGALDNQMRTDNQGAIENMWLQNQADNTYSFIDKTNPWYNPQGNLGIDNNTNKTESELKKENLKLKNLLLESKLKYGGKVKFKTKLGKKK